VPGLDVREPDAQERDERRRRQRAGHHLTEELEAAKGEALAGELGWSHGVRHGIEN
jgi:hypothetical protein